jgi:hypothetical protein
MNKILFVLVDTRSDRTVSDVLKSRMTEKCHKRLVVSVDTSKSVQMGGPLNH